MKILISLAAFALLAACITPARPGIGVVESVHAPAIGNTAIAATNAPRENVIKLRMQDGTEQSVSHISGAWRRGDKVRVTADGKLERLE